MGKNGPPSAECGQEQADIVILANILITADDRGNHPLPELVQANIASFREQHRGLDHHFFDGESARAFLQSRYGTEVLTAFDSLKPYAYKADLARYCILHEYGGVYADLSFFFQKPVNFDGKRLAIFRDFMSSTPWDTSNGIFAAPPRHKALAKAIELVCANVRRQYYGPSSLCPTGPTLFGKAIALTCEAEELIMGRAMWREPTRPGEPKYHCMTSFGQTIAIKRKTVPGSITELGISTGNNYHNLWVARDIYRPAY